MGKGTKVISFIGGLVFVSVVAVVVILKNDKVRSELEAQAQSLLNTSKNAIEQVQMVTTRIGSITGSLKTDKENSKLAGGAPTLQGNQNNASDDGYDLAWKAIEEQMV